MKPKSSYKLFDSLTPFSFFFPSPSSSSSFSFLRLFASFSDDDSIITLDKLFHYINLLLFLFLGGNFGGVTGDHLTAGKSIDDRCG